MSKEQWSHVKSKRKDTDQCNHSDNLKGKQYVYFKKLKIKIKISSQKRRGDWEKKKT